MRHIGLIVVIGLAALGLARGAETVHYGTHRFVGDVIGAGSSNAVESSTMVVLWETNNWTPPAATNYLGEFDSYAGFTAEGSKAAWSVYVQPNGEGWSLSQTNVPVNAYLVLEIPAIDGDNSLSNFVLYGYSDPTTYGRTNDLTSQYLLVRRPWTGHQAANKSYVDATHADLSGWATFAAGTNVYLDGQQLWMNMDWAWTNSVSTNGSELALLDAGVPVVSVNDGASRYLPIATYEYDTNGYIRLGVDTNLVSGTLVVETSPTVEHPRWWRIASTSSQPDATNGLYIATVSTNDVLGFLRARDVQGIHQASIAADAQIAGMLSASNLVIRGPTLSNQVFGLVNNGESLWVTGEGGYWMLSVGYRDGDITRVNGTLTADQIILGEGQQHSIVNMGARISGVAMTNNWVYADGAKIGATGANVISDSGSKINGVGITNGVVSTPILKPQQLVEVFDECWDVTKWTSRGASGTILNSPNATYTEEAFYGVQGMLSLFTLNNAVYYAFYTYGAPRTFHVTPTNTFELSASLYWPATTDDDRPRFEFGVTYAYDPTTYTNYTSNKSVFVRAHSNDLYLCVVSGTSNGSTNYLGIVSNQWMDVRFVLTTTNSTLYTNGVLAMVEETDLGVRSFSPSLYIYRDAGNTNYKRYKFSMDWMRIRTTTNRK